VIKKPLLILNQQGLFFASYLATGFDAVAQN